VIVSDKAYFTALETGQAQEDKVVVIRGLKAGDAVVARGSNLLEEGDRVRVMAKGQQGGSQQQERQAESLRQPGEKPGGGPAPRQASAPGQPQQQTH